MTPLADMGQQEEMDLRKEICWLFSVWSNDGTHKQKCSRKAEELKVAFREKLGGGGWDSGINTTNKTLEEQSWETDY